MQQIVKNHHLNQPAHAASYSHYLMILVYSSNDHTSNNRKRLTTGLRLQKCILTPQLWGRKRVGREVVHVVWSRPSREVSRPRLNNVVAGLIRGFGWPRALCTDHAHVYGYHLRRSYRQVDCDILRICLKQSRE